MGHTSMLEGPTLPTTTQFVEKSAMLDTNIGFSWCTRGALRASKDQSKVFYTQNRRLILSDTDILTYIKEHNAKKMVENALNGVKTIPGVDLALRTQCAWQCSCTSCFGRDSSEK